LSRCPTANRAWPPSRRAARESLGHTSPTECQRIGASAADAHLLLRTHHRCPVAYLAAVPLQVVPYFSLIQSQDAGDGAHQIAASACLRPGEFISIARTGKPNSYGNSGQKRNCEEIRLLFHDTPSFYHHRTGVSSYPVERTQPARSSTGRVLLSTPGCVFSRYWGCRDATEASLGVQGHRCVRLCMLCLVCQ